MIEVKKMRETIETKETSEMTKVTSTTDTRETTKSLLTFLIITFSLSSIFYYLIGIAGILEMSYLLMWCPGVAAIAVSLLYHRGENAMNFRKCAVKYNIAALWIVAVIGAVSYGVYFIVYGKAILQENQVIAALAQSPMTLLLYLFIYFITAFGEEIGWRGYLCPKLMERFGFTKGTLYTGLIWAAWHMPVYVTGYLTHNLEKPVPLAFQLPMVTLLLLGWSFVKSYIFTKTRSVWPAAIFHFAYNFIYQVLLDQSFSGEMRPYLVGETGALTIAALLITAAICVKRYNSESRKTGEETEALDSLL